MTNPHLYSEPNAYELTGRDLTLQYAKVGIAGVPVLTFLRRGVKKAYRGDEIRTMDTPFGQLVTVLVDAVPDLHTIHLTLVVPAMNLDGFESSIRTFAVFTTELTSIGGPRLVKGQLHRYETVPLSGKALAPDR